MISNALNLIHLYGIIYGGQDDRKEVPSTPPEVLANAGSVACIVHRKYVDDNAYTVKTQTFTDEVKARRGFGLCSGEPFDDEYTMEHCSTGFLISNQLVMTSGHGLRTRTRQGRVPVDPKTRRFIFGFDETTPINNGRLEFDDKDIYEGDSYVQEPFKDNLDWAVIRLNKPVDAKYKPIQIFSRCEDIDVCDSIYMIGHPYGLPRKYVDNASVKVLDNSKHFHANLDAFEENSGSPVFDAGTHAWIGMYIRTLEEDNDDLTEDDNAQYCYISRKTNSDGSEQCLSLCVVEARLVELIGTLNRI
jgi:V8-like Glu-specific endopeptidase